MAVKLKPLHDKIVIEKPEEEKTTKSGIILPDNAKEKPQTGKVIAVGNGKVLDNGTKLPLEIKVGDTVYYSKYSGTEIKIDEKEYIIIAENDVLAIVA
ncbi:molecular chaperone GroES [Candidatus Termititenax persephonae]|uniref:Co-chaperonin GroES n=1 Tax=Candidatus Termititenax persephonae TaxID=2218525 RepID=A0A388TGM2_9BACT|nr:molecular chaperone GroES [Candidatus Termititenax persephonae]